ncbi:toxin-antitoxin system HicB family antitoxin [Streptomyces sp. NPDC058451]|uniref:toxin-antitoxin system HicB family antitoxin n=1 Tax=unclassified Streptomyces TaxID=2593676 RepID=UPI0036629B06
MCSFEVEGRLLDRCTRATSTERLGSPARSARGNVRPRRRGAGGTYRPKAGGVNLRLPDDLHDRAKVAAADDDRSLNS